MVNLIKFLFAGDVYLSKSYSTMVSEDLLFWQLQANEEVGTYV